MPPKAFGHVTKSVAHRVRSYSSYSQSRGTRYSASFASALPGSGV